MSRHQGKVRWFNEIKGYGFIEDQNGGDVFVHASQIIIHGYKKLSQGETVYFDLKEGAKGPVAFNVDQIPENSALVENILFQSTQSSIA
ncbi:MAG: hypothetical protein A3G32_00885 [Deltaproteobacteria bacterium RIFCSPLOWO2_12_FULL_40_28]|nr:MAG: hypothetical protein A3C45_09770 [Deltaproteobacteria bacterium RIFCSPHIGHO2_02_FULL_40_28]OGQ19893.1 MAG: hypothetical protein A3E27_06720 [Deltaproteobacteria bacterium RIFCSPHIGHO2_12_FULL_40_32]OGQ39652.1 MAG: hypothetical protein A3I69_06150 [Deltaproteobacteria bacterium RIFCSPLOWO2_02_FULL_40_36]OGQ52908.1 MAG: hypothetical protein A3G32_00885 [Deltaproteobacteria bacterium RIFCSPLOWO2_12_FULL_40_28]